MSYPVAAMIMFAALLVSACTESEIEPAPTKTYVFGAEANRLHVYDPATGEKSIVIPSRADDPSGLDINAQICFFPDGSRRFIAGEDTGQNMGIRQGWGIFQLLGDSIDTFSAVQLGKVSPTYQPSNDNAENYGCGFLSDGRLLTGDVGNQAFGPSDGQLIVWFPPFDRPPDQQHYCKLYVGIATAGGIWVDSQDRIYITSSRGGDMPGGGRVFRYSPPYPTSDDASGGCSDQDDTGAPLADNVTKEVFIEDNIVPTPSALVQTPSGSFYVSSVFSGTIAEYSEDGVFIGYVLEPEHVPPPPFAGGTPYGIGLDSKGTVYYADIGIVIDEGGIGPGRNTGKVRQIRFENGAPLPPETLDSGLNFPDGIGILEE